MYKLTIISLFIFALMAQARHLYVTPSGETNDSSFNSIQKAIWASDTADTIILRKGRYREHVVLEKPGTADHPFMLLGEDSAIIDGSGIGLSSNSNGIVEASNLQHIIIRNIMVQNASRAGIRLNSCQDVRVTHCATYNTLSSGIGIWFSTNVTVDSNDVDLAVNSDSDTLGQECITVAGCDSFEIFANHVQRGGEGDWTKFGGEGIDAKHGRNGKIYNNYVHHTSRLGIYVDSWDVHMSNIEVFNNIVHDCPSGIAACAEYGGLLENVRIYNNLCYNNGWAGIQVEGDINWGDPSKKHPIKNIMIYNNTVVNNWTGIRGSITGDVDSLFIYNNILMNNDNQIEFDGTHKDSFYLDIANNCIAGKTAYEGINAILENPQLQSVSAGKFDPKEGSPVIDKSSPLFVPAFDILGKSRSYGSGADLGAFEYTETPIINSHSQKADRKYPKIQISGSTLHIDEDKTGIVEIVSMDGRVHHKGEYSRATTVEIADLAKGIYILRVQNRFVQPFVIR